MANFFNELKRRHVFRIGIAYLVVAWLLTQVVGIIGPMFALPTWFPRAVVILLAIGFPVALILAWAFEMTPEGVKLTDELDEAEPRRRMVPTGRKLDFIIIGALVIAVGFLLWRQYFSAPAQTAQTAPVSAPIVAKPAADILPNSVAVLPFENLSPKPDDAYFAAGLHEEVIDQISKIHSMSVIARSSVIQYAKEAKPVPEVARELHVETVMEGSVRFANDRVRVSAQLVDGVTGTNLWSDTYERPLGDVFKIESDIAMNVANALQAQFSPEEQARIEKAPTKSPEAYALYLQALAVANGGNAARGISLFQQAVSIDPQFSLAYAAMAVYQAQNFINSTNGNAVPRDQLAALEALSRKNAERSIEIDPDVENAHYALAIPALAKWHWTEADKSFARALEAAPNDPNARLFYGFLLSWTGRHDQAIAITKRAVELNPGNPNAGQYGMQLGYAGQYAAAAEVLEDELTVHPMNLLARDWLAFMEIANGSPAAAIKQLELSEQLAGSHPTVVYLPEWAYAYGRAGRPADAKRLFDRLKMAADNGTTPGAGGWAMAYLAIGDERQALDWLEKAAKKAANHEPDEGLYNLMNLKLNVTNDPVLKKPEFVDVLSRIKGD
jgi:TolB-like protein